MQIGKQNRSKSHRPHPKKQYEKPETVPTGLKSLSGRMGKAKEMYQRLKNLGVSRNGHPAIR
jgi:hypothetical protein